MEIVTMILVVAVLHLYYLFIRRNALIKEATTRVLSAIDLLNELNSDVLLESRSVDKRMQKIRRKQTLLAEALGLVYEPGTSTTSTEVIESKYVKASKKKKAVSKS